MGTKETHSTATGLTRPASLLFWSHDRMKQAGTYTRRDQQSEIPQPH